MKITVSKTIAYDIVQFDKYQEEVEIDDVLFQEIEQGQHPDYASLEEWAQDQDIDFVEILDSWQGDCNDSNEEWSVDYE